jgi:hypothetical protein
MFEVSGAAGAPKKHYFPSEADQKQTTCFTLYGFLHGRMQVLLSFNI